jgi:DNA-binding beta-propeller fold protein YncE
MTSWGASGRERPSVSSWRTRAACEWVAIVWLAALAGCGSRRDRPTPAEAGVATVDSGRGARDAGGGEVDAAQADAAGASELDAASEDAGLDAGAPSSPGPSDAAVDADDGAPDASDAAIEPPVPSCDPAIAGGQLTAIPLLVNAIARDPLRRRVYAAIRRDAPAYANELVTIDPAQPAVIDRVAIGDEPTQLALSDDGSTLWVGLRGSHEIRKVDLSGGTPAPGARFSVDLPSGSSSPGPMVVLPHTRGSVAVSLHNYDVSPSFTGAVIFDEGVARLGQPSSLSGASRLTSGPPGVLFGSDDETTAFSFGSFSVGASGLQILGGGPSFVSGFGTDIRYDTDGFVYATSGQVVDVSVPESPRRAGVFPYRGAVWPQPDSDLALMVSLGNGDYGPLVLRKLDSSSFAQVSSRVLGDAHAEFHYVQDALLSGSDALVFIAGRYPAAESNLYVWRECALDTLPRSAALDVVAIERGGLREIPLAARALIADSARGRFYAAIDSRAETLPNRLVTIDPVASTVIAHVPVGSEPAALALADDASTLWVSLRGSYAIRRVDLIAASATPLEQHVLPPRHRDRMAGARALVVVPGTTRSVAAALEFDDVSPRYAGFTLLDDGVERAMSTLRYDESTALAAGPSGVLYGFTAYGSLHAFELSPALVSVRRATAGVVRGDAAAQSRIRYDPDGLLLVSSGEIVDVSDPLDPQRRGVLPFTGELWAEPGSDTVLMVSAGDGAGGPLVLRNLDAASATQLSASVIGDPGAHFDFVSDLAVLPPDTLAFIAGATGQQGASIYVLRDPDLLAAVMRPQVELSPVRHGALHELAFDAQAIAADPTRGRVYALAGDRDPQVPNELLAIDARQHAVLAHVPIGSRPNALALSGDASTLWVGLSGSFELREVALDGDLPVPGTRQRLPFGYVATLASARSMVVLPQTTNSLAVALEDLGASSSHSLGYTVIDDGMPRAASTHLHAVTRLILGPPGLLFGYDELTTGFELATFALDPGGLTFKTGSSSLVSGFETEISYDPDGYVYASSGEIVDVGDPLAPESAGMFPVAGSVWPVPNSPRVWMVSIDGSRQLVLRELDTSTLDELSSRVISAPGQRFDAVKELLHVTPGVLAFRARRAADGAAHVYLYDDPQLLP